MQMHCMDLVDMKHYLETGISGIEHRNKNCEEMVGGELEAMEKTLVTRYSININNSKSQS